MFLSLVIMNHFSSMWTMLSISLNVGWEDVREFSSNISRQNFNLWILLPSVSNGFRLLVWRFNSPHLNLKCKVERLTPKDFARDRIVLLLFSEIVVTLESSKSYLLRPTCPFLWFDTSTLSPFSICSWAVVQILPIVRMLVFNMLAMSSLSFL